MYPLSNVMLFENKFELRVELGCINQMHCKTTKTVKLVRIMNVFEYSFMTDCVTM